MRLLLRIALRRRACSSAALNLVSDADDGTVIEEKAGMLGAIVVYAMMINDHPDEELITPYL